MSRYKTAVVKSVSNVKQKLVYTYAKMNSHYRGYINRCTLV